MKRIYVLIRLHIHYLPSLASSFLIKNRLIDECFIFNFLKFVPESFQLCLIVCPPLRWLPYSVRVVDFGGKLILATKRNQPRRQMKIDPCMIDYVKPKSVMNTLITVYSHIVTSPLSYSSINPSCH
jgi:hypothetical protein